MKMPQAGGDTLLLLLQTSDLTQLPRRIHAPSSPIQRQTYVLHSNLWSSLDDLWGSLVLVLFKVLVEQGSELGDLLLEVRGTRPALGWVEDLVRNIGASLWHLEVEGLVILEFSLCELAAVDGVEDGAGVFEWTTLATGGGTGAGPAGVEQPCVGVVVGHLLREHLCVTHWVQGQEGLCEARGEGCLWLGDTLLSSSHLRGVTTDEVEHGLLAVELRDWWEDTAGVAGEKDDVGWVVVGDTRDLGVLDVFDGVCAAGVLCEGGVVVVDSSGLWVENNILQDGSELDGVENVGLCLGRETNALSVAASLDVENTPVTPAVLVVSDQSTLRVRREGGLASTGKTEEDGHVAILTLVGGRVKSQHVVLDRHLVEEHGEDTNGGS